MGTDKKELENEHLRAQLGGEDTSFREMVTVVRHFLPSPDRVIFLFAHPPLSTLETMIV